VELFGVYQSLGDKDLALAKPAVQLSTVSRAARHPERHGE
jgi:hypothetical protein